MLESSPGIVACVLLGMRSANRPCITKAAVSNLVMESTRPSNPPIMNSPGEFGLRRLSAETTYKYLTERPSVAALSAFNASP